MATNWCNLLLLFRVIIFSSLSWSFFKLYAGVDGASIRYDQSQSGDYNVQIHLKNIELYAILDEGILNSEYDYDYSELTEKPSTAAPGQQWPSVNSTTSKPASQNTSSHQANSSLNNNSSSNNNNNNPLSSINSSALVITNQLLATPENINATIEHDSTPIKIRKCAPGYYRDNLGRCRRLRKPHIPFLQMVHSPGVIKSFQHAAETHMPSTSTGKSL